MGKSSITATSYFNVNTGAVQLPTSLAWLPITTRSSPLTTWNTTALLALPCAHPCEFCTSRLYVAIISCTSPTYPFAAVNVNTMSKPHYMYNLIPMPPRQWTWREWFSRGEDWQHSKMCLRDGQSTNYLISYLHAFTGGGGQMNWGRGTERRGKPISPLSCFQRKEFQGVVSTTNVSSKWSRNLVLKEWTVWKTRRTARVPDEDLDLEGPRKVIKSLHPVGALSNVSSEFLGTLGVHYHRTN